MDALRDQVQSVLGARPLRAAQLGHAGQRVEAAESPLVTERDHDDRHSGIVWAAMGVNQLRASRRRTQAGEPAVVASQVLPSESMKPIVEEARKIVDRLAPATDRPATSTVPAKRSP